ncbi:hypothetical protein FD754_006705, partial [Muntiacus muntjak]
MLKSWFSYPWNLQLSPWSLLDTVVRMLSSLLGDGESSDSHQASSERAVCFSGCSLKMFLFTGFSFIGILANKSRLWEKLYLELESSGHRNEVRLHYRSGSHHPHTEVFPYILADDKWHKLSLAISASHLILHVDCNKIYERVVEKPSTDLPLGTSFWLGQRNNAHGYFKGIMQDVQLLVMPQGFIAQCPDLNRTCPTCNDFHGLVQKIMELQDILAKTSAKLSRAEQRMNRLDQCYCERTCTMKGTTYREFESWTDGCKNCTCLNGTIQCETLICPNPDCPLKSALAYVDGKCCKECK